MVRASILSLICIFGFNEASSSADGTFERSSELGERIARTVETEEELMDALSDLPEDTDTAIVTDITARWLGIVHQKHKLAKVAFQHYLQVSTTPEADYWIDINDLIGDYGEHEQVHAFLWLVSVSGVMEQESFERTVNDLIDYTLSKGKDPHALFAPHVQRIPEPRRAFTLSALSSTHREDL